MRITVEVTSNILGNYKIIEEVSSYEELEELKKDYKRRVGINDYQTTIVFYNLLEMGYFEQIV